MLIDPIGFLLKCPDTEAFPIDANAIHYLVSKKYIPLPAITRDEIWDRSKADFFAKAATVIQSAWLIIGSIGRVASRLPISPLETFTLAFIVSTVMSYFFWWRKPQNVETPVIVACEHTMAKIRSDAGLTEDSWEYSPTEFIEREHKKWKRRTIFEVSQSPLRNCMPDLEQGTSSSGSALSVAEKPSRVDSEKTLASTVSEKQLPLRMYDDSILPGGLAPLILLSVALPSMVHSAIHLLGWNFQFPTYTEKQLWRISAVVLNAMAAVTVGGVRVLAILGYKGRFNLIYIWVNNPIEDAQEQEQDTNKNDTETRWWKRLSIWDALLTLATVSLLVARFFIIAEVIISFRRLPKNVFVTVNWADFIPHV